MKEMKFPFDRAFQLLASPSRPNPREVLGLLSELSLQSFRILRMRYYRYKRESQMLYSAASWNHTSENETVLARGRVCKIFRDSVNKDADTFWCMTETAPIIFETVTDSVYPLQCRKTRNGLRTMRVRDDCHPIKSEKSGCWIDIPIEIAGVFIGKVSCDIHPIDIESITADDVECLCSSAVYLAPHLESILSARNLELIQKESVSDLRARIVAANTLEELYSVCIDQLPDILGCKYASFFTVSEDSLGIKKLILRRSSYPALAGEVDLRTYDLGDDESDGEIHSSITCWATANKRSLRLHDLGEPTMPSEALGAALHQYDSSLQWGNKVQDSDNHISFLGVPILDPRDTSSTPYPALGVIRFTQKIGENHEFTSQDEVLVEWLVRDCIGPKLAALPSAEFADNVLDQLESFHDVAILESTDHDDFSIAVCASLDRALVRGQDSHKLFVFNLLHEGGATFYHRAIFQPNGCSTSIAAVVGETHELRGTFTELALDYGEAVMILDLRKASALELIRNAVSDAVCAIACPIAYKKHELGAIVAFSNRYDLSLETHGRILSMVAGLAFQIIARRQARTFSLALAGLRHDVLTILDLVKGRLKKSRLSSGMHCEPGKVCSNTSDLLEFLGRLGDAYTQEYPVKPNEFERTINDLVPVKRGLQLAREAAEAEVQSDSIVTIDCPDDLAPRHADSILVAIVYNLTKNALRFCSNLHKPIRIRASITTDSDAKQWLKILVRDNGTGMSAATKERVKSRIQLDQLVNVESMLAGKRGMGGKGLLVAALLSAHYRLVDGRTARLKLARSVESKGSIFRLDLPIPD